MIKKIIKSNEFITFLIIVALSVVIGIINPAFFTVSTLFDILRASNVYNIMAFGLLLVVILGGVDISFVAISAVASYGTHMLMLKLGYEGGIGLYFLIAAIIGLTSGLLNGFLIYRFKLPIFDLTLATQTMWYGFSLFFLGATANFDLPEGMVGYYAEYITTVQDSFVGQTGLHISVIYVAIIGIAIWWILKYTMLGRGIYAIGGNREVAIRSGYNIKKITLIVFAIMGVLASIAGITQSGFQRNFNPTLFIGQNLDVLAAVILGGASIRGGKGTVIGTFLGVILIQLINRALILTGISTGLTEGKTVTGFPVQLEIIGKNTVFGIPIPYIIFILLTFLVYIILNHTTFGFKVRMLGSNPTASNFSGINNPSIVMKTYILSGLLAAIAGVIVMSRTMSAAYEYGSKTYVLLTILISVLAGVQAGFGNVLNVFLGVSILQVLSTGFHMLLLGMRGSSFFKDFSWGVLLIAIFIINYLTNKRKVES